MLGRAWREGVRIVGQMAKGLPDQHQPPDLPTLVAPRLIELCFQTAGLWEIAGAAWACLNMFAGYAG